MWDKHESDANKTERKCNIHTSREQVSIKTLQQHKTTMKKRHLNTAQKNATYLAQAHQCDANDIPLAMFWFQSMKNATSRKFELKQPVFILAAKRWRANPTRNEHTHQWWYGTLSAWIHVLANKQKHRKSTDQTSVVCKRTRALIKKRATIGHMRQYRVSAKPRRSDQRLLLHTWTIKQWFRTLAMIAQQRRHKSKKGRREGTHIHSLVLTAKRHLKMINQDYTNHQTARGRWLCPFEKFTLGFLNGNESVQDQAV